MLSERRAFNCFGFVQLHKEPALLICSSRVNVCDETSSDVARGEGEERNFRKEDFNRVGDKDTQFQLAAGRLFLFFYYYDDVYLQV